ncbi:MAG: Hachiman antiphage defense system protein HamA, partial [Candidatus Thiodiazotropha sp.]
MVSFPDWTEELEEEIGGQALRLVIVADGQEETARNRTVDIVPGHYASPEKIARLFEKLGKEAVAEFLRTNLPTKRSLRSGDLGEIFATEYIDERTEFSAPVKRLRWKDHREMAMRGDDVIGIRLPGQGERIRFIKVEAKSEASLKTRTIANARDALDGDDGLPSSHALSFMSQRLLEMGQEDLSDAIDRAQLRDGINTGQVSHMLFAFSGNDPGSFLRADLETYAGPVQQQSVGLRITN